MLELRQTQIQEICEKMEEEQFAILQELQNKLRQ